MLADDWVAAVDLGSAKTLAVVARRGAAGWRLCGHGTARTRGVTKGVVTDPEAAAHSLRTALTSAFSGLGLSLGGPDGAPVDGNGPVPPVWLGISGDDLLDEPARVDVAVEGGRVRPEHVEACVQQLAASAGAHRATLHLLDRSFLPSASSSSQAAAAGRAVPNPVGRAASRLGARARVVSCRAPQIAAVREAALAAPMAVNDLTLSALAAGRAVLDEEERAMGTAVVDFGGGTIDLAAFRGGEPRRVASLPMGSQFITNDLAIGLGIPWAAAESLKCRHARVDGALVQKVVEVPSAEGTAVDLPLVDEIVLARVDEILERAEPLLAEMREEVGLPGGIVLTGGGAALKGLPKRVMEKWNLPVRVGMPGVEGERFRQLAEPAAAAAMGLLDLAMRAPARESEGAEAAPRGAVATVGRRIVAWLSGLV